MAGGAGCPDGWAFTGAWCTTHTNDCTSNVCNNDAKKKQVYDHYYARCYQEANGQEYFACYWDGSSKNGCC